MYPFEMKITWKKNSSYALLRLCSQVSFSTSGTYCGRFGASCWSYRLIYFLPLHDCCNASLNTLARLCEESVVWLLLLLQEEERITNQFIVKVPLLRLLWYLVEASFRTIMTATLLHTGSVVEIVLLLGWLYNDYKSTHSNDWSVRAY